MKEMNGENSAVSSMAIDAVNVVSGHLLLTAELLPHWEREPCSEKGEKDRGSIRPLSLTQVSLLSVLRKFAL
ncbi:hypothetical protein ACOMHN_037592 [Nucella lapillus]